MKESVLEHALKTAGSMIAFTIMGTILLTTIYGITKAPIAENERQAKLALLKQVIDDSLYDNDVLTTTVSVPASTLLGTKQAGIANIATRNHKPIAVILEAIAADGYAGDIKLLVAILTNGEISGVRVIAHKETPGLGDYIDIAKDNWINIFNGKSLQQQAAAWQVKKDGGEYDYKVGATITPRAVVKQVARTLQYFQQHRESLLTPSNSNNSQTRKMKKVNDEPAAS